jgi:hypothetical protein
MEISNALWIKSWVEVGRDMGMPACRLTPKTVPVIVKQRRASVKLATVKSWERFRLRIEQRDKIGYVAPEHYEILVEHPGQGA